MLRDKLIRKRTKEVNYYKSKLGQKGEFKYKADVIEKDITAVSGYYNESPWQPVFTQKLSKDVKEVERAVPEVA